MGKIKLLLLLSAFFVGQFAVACGSTMTYQNGGQTNTSSQCPANTNSSSTGVKADIGGMNFGPGYAEAMAAKAKAESKAAKKGYCLAASQKRYDDDYEDLWGRKLDSYADCRLIFINDLSALETCSGQAEDHFNLDLDGLDEDQKIRDKYCEQLYGS